MKSVYVNQLGYRTHEAKKAVVPVDDRIFELVRAGDGAVRFNGKSGKPIYDAASASTVRGADFSAFSEKGEFILRTESGESFPFCIGDNPYNGLRAALLAAFDFQKCGVAAEAGPWAHPPCHTAPAVVYGSAEKRDVSGGWHDAGDYGRYAVPAAKAVADLLLTGYAPNPDAGLLQTVWFEIEWLLKMQCEKTGGVYHKVTCAGFNPLDEPPHEEKGELILSPVSLAATAGFAATAALAARFYPEKRELLLEAAERAWEWLEANPNAPGFKNPPEIRTGEYGDNHTADEIFRAACELFAATGGEKYHAAVKKSEVHVGLDWANVGTYGIVAYLLADGKDGKLAAGMKQSLHLVCEEILKKNRNEPYGTSQGVYYRWGSNLDVANSAMHLLLYDRFVEKSPEYAAAAMEHMHYLLGRNPLSQSYITGFGSRPPLNPHHRPSVAAGEAIPGLVVGGPNANTPRDAVLQAYCEGQPPSKFYFDHSESFASNEVAVYWNSAVYFAAAMLEM